MSTLEKVQLLEERIKKAIHFIEKLKAEKAALTDEVELLRMHNEELKSYTTDYSKTNRLIEEGITSALDQLGQLEELTVQPVTAAEEAFEEEALPEEQEGEESFTFAEADEESEEEAEEKKSQALPDEDAPLY